MKKKVIITGGAGRIGTIIHEDLGKDFDFFLFDNVYQVTEKNKRWLDILRIDTDASYEATFSQAGALIHLAWDSIENWKSGIVEPVNKKMAENVYARAVKSGIKRVIMASSIHAQDVDRPNIPYIVGPNEVSVPDSPYGATKLYIEALGRYYARKYGLEVICIRFGGVDPKDVIRPEPDYRKIVLSRRDCANLIRRCLMVDQVYDKFCLVYGISANIDTRYGWSNSLGWTPQDDGAKM